MKPLQIGLLVIGAAIAGGIAVRMTQPPAVPAPVEVAADVAKPSPPAPVQPTPTAAPPAETKAVAAKPSPIPVAALAQPAPAPVYNEEPKPAVRKSSRPAPVAVAKLPVGKVPVARAAVPKEAVAKLKPNEWPPQPYSTSAPPAPPDAPVPAPIIAPAPVEEAAVPEPPAPRQVTLPTGMTIPVRLNESLSTDRVMPGDTFWASLADPLVVDGLVIAERGDRVSGRIINSIRAGRMSGNSVLTLTLATVSTSDGQRVPVSTEPWTRQADSSRNQDLATIGGGAALGAIIGAIAGGGKGAAIGAGIGGGAGIGAAAATRGKSASVPSETVINFRLASRVTITEQIAQR
jgi:hypothetical protein